jgi:hypothetical protein
LKEDISSIKTLLVHHDQTCALRERRLQTLELQIRRLNEQFLSEKFSTDQRDRLAARTYHSNWTTRYLGMSVQVVVSKDRKRNIYSVLLHWPLLWALAVMLRLTFPRPWPACHFSILRPIRTISKDAAIIKACVENSITRIRELLTSGEAHVTDRTEDNSTLLEVSALPKRKRNGADFAKVRN